MLAQPAPTPVMDMPPPTIVFEAAAPPSMHPTTSMTAIHAPRPVKAAEVDRRALGGNLEHTGRLLEREDVISQFVKDVIKKTGKATDVLRRRRSDVWDDYSHYCCAVS
jgi:hypothetical protein